ncbi:MAG: regulatory protein LuxR, partial [Polaromonas sp.]|nr:regulatory protein LuxR [Polaromonas sp.]
LHNAALALAASKEFGAPWQNSDAPLVAWQDISRSASGDTSPWRQRWQAQGFQSVVRVAFALPAARAFECYLFSLHHWLDCTEPMQVAWSTFNIWPVLKRSLAQARNPLSERELECLGLAFEGLTARKTSETLACTERTVNFHLANAMDKLHADNKLAAVQRACWFGLI